MYSWDSKDVAFLHKGYDHIFFSDMHIHSDGKKGSGQRKKNDMLKAFASDVLPLCGVSCNAVGDIFELQLASAHQALKAAVPLSFWFLGHLPSSVSVSYFVGNHDSDFIELVPEVSGRVVLHDRTRAAYEVSVASTSRRKVFATHGDQFDNHSRFFDFLDKFNFRGTPFLGRAAKVLDKRLGRTNEKALSAHRSRVRDYVRKHLHPGDIFVFGHTHSPEVFFEDGIMCVDLGSSVHDRVEFAVMKDGQIFPLFYK